MPSVRLLILYGLLGIALAGLGLPAAAYGATAASGQQADQSAALPKAEKIKAAYLYNFTKFTRWQTPAFADANSPIVLCSFAGDAFNAFLAALTHERTGAGDRQLQVLGNPDVDLLRRCHLVYLEQPWPGGNIPECACLVVVDRELTPDPGAALTFFVEDRRLRFAVNQQQLAQRGITLSSELLALAGPMPNADRKTIPLAERAN